jgi:hypothetical protein
MKKIFLLIVLFSNSISFAQYQYTYGPNMPGGDITGMAIKDNFLYFGSYDQNKIYKIDLNGEPNQTPIVVVNNISGVMSLKFNGNDLYISSFNSNSIRKIDVSKPEPSLENVVSDVIAGSGIQFYNNYLYIAEAYGYKISRIDLSNPNSTKEIIISDANGPWDIDIYEDELYISETYGNKISKFNLLDSNPILQDVVTDITAPYSICVKNGFLYYNHTNQSYQSSKLSRVSLTDSNIPSVEVNYSNWYGHGLGTRLINHNDYFYIGTNGAILKYENNTLNLENINLKKSIKIFPNPISDYVIVSNLNEEREIKFIDLQGRIIKSLKIKNGERINTQDLSSGIYYIMLNNKLSKKFIKL